MCFTKLRRVGQRGRSKCLQMQHRRILGFFVCKTDNSGSIAESHHIHQFKYIHILLEMELAREDASVGGYIENRIG